MPIRRYSRRFTLAAALLLPLAELVLTNCGLITAGVSVPEAFSHNGTIGLRGTVRDLEGKPLGQTLITVDRDYYLWHADSSYDESSSFMVVADPAFNIGPMRAHQLAFTFKHPGYAQQSVTVDQAGNIVSDHGRGVAGESWGPSPDFLVVLEKADRPMSRLRMIMREVDFTDPDKNPAISLAGAGNDNAAATSPSPPPHSLYAVIERQPLKTSGTEKRVDPLDLNLPARFALHISDPDGGFARFTPVPGTRPFDHQMVEGPETGYSAEFVLDDKRLRQMRDPASNRILDRSEFFYFRADNKYGKGVLTWALTNDESRPLRLLFVMFIQPDGTRVLAGDS